MSDYGARAAAALNEFLPGQHRDKTVARLFGVSLRLAQYLRAGQCWTTERFTQASKAFGVDFDLRLSGIDLHSEIADMRRRMLELETLLNRGETGEVSATLGGASPYTTGRVAAVTGLNDRAEVTGERVPKRGNK